MKQISSAIIIDPGCRGNIKPVHNERPDYESQLNWHRGAAFQLQALLLKSGWFRPYNRFRDTMGLYLVGAGTHFRARVPNVILSADTTAKEIFKDSS